MLRAGRLQNAALISTTRWLSHSQGCFIHKSEKRNSVSTMARKFGPWPINDYEVFHESKLAFAFVNLKPILPGHVLISTNRVVSRFQDLTADEVADLWQLAQTVGVKMQEYHKADSLTLAIQDGKSAGQTVPHVHIHCIPRRPGDFEKNDEIYDVMDQKEKEYSEEKQNQEQNLGKKLDADERKPRTAEEMASEAAEYRKLFAS